MLLYFSCTGNTEWVARQLGKALGEHPMLITQQEVTLRLTKGERLGIVIPIHGWRPPTLVRQFFRRCKLIAAGKPYTYVVFTAGDTIGMADKYLAADLQVAGIRADAVFSVLMPESYVGLPGMDVDTPAREWEKKQQAAADVQSIVADVFQKKQDICKVTRGPLPMFFSKVVGGFFHRFLVTDRPFHVRKDKCIGCARCTQVCPVENMEMGKDATPEWKHNGRCLTCFACYHHCPRHAIEFGNRTRKKGQYFFK